VNTCFASHGRRYLSGTEAKAAPKEGSTNQLWRLAPRNVAAREATCKPVERTLGHFSGHRQSLPEKTELVSPAKLRNVISMRGDKPCHVTSQNAVWAKFGEYTCLSNSFALFSAPGLGSNMPF
jgi:hypothetical protein